MNEDKGKTLKAKRRLSLIKENKNIKSGSKRFLKFYSNPIKVDNFNNSGKTTIHEK